MRRFLRRNEMRAAYWKQTWFFFSLIGRRYYLRLGASLTGILLSRPFKAILCPMAHHLGVGLIRVKVSNS